MHYLIIVLSLFFANPLNANNNNQSNSIIAVVDDEVVTLLELASSIKYYQQENSDKVINKKIILSLLDQYIDVIVQKQYAKKIGIQMRPDVLQNKISAMAKQNKISLLMFRQLANYEQIVENISAQSIINGLQSIITKEATMVSKESLEASYQQALAQKIQYDLSNIVLEDKDLAKEIVEKLKDEPNAFALLALEHSQAYNAKNNGAMGYRTYQSLPSIYQQTVASLTIGKISPIIYQANDQLYHLIKVNNIKYERDKLEHQIKINHIFIAKKPKNKQTDSLLDAQPDRVLETILKIHERIKSGESFVHLAKEFSQDDYAENGGKLPWIDINKLPLEGRITFNGLAKLEVSPPFESQFGWHIIQKIAQKKVSQLKLSLQNKLLVKVKKEVYQVWLKNLKEKTYIKIYDKKIQSFINRQ